MIASCLPSNWQTQNQPQALLEFLTYWHYSHCLLPIGQNYYNEYCPIHSSQSKQLFICCHCLMAGLLMIKNNNIVIVMQSPVKLNKINPRLSGSRREQKSYTDRYRQKARPIPKTPTTPRSPVEQSPGDLSSRGERIIQLIAVGCDPSTIRIEEEADEYQIMKNEYMETELLMSKMATDTRNDIHQLREQIKTEQKTIKQMEKVLTSKRARLTTLQQKQATTLHALQSTPLEDYDQFINSLQQEYDTIDAIGEREISAAREQCGQLQAECNGLDRSINDLDAEIDSLGNFTVQRYNNSLADLIEQEEQLANDISAMERECEEIARNMRERQSERPIKEEVHRKYLELYEKMFVNSQLDKMTILIEYKQEEIKRLEAYKKHKEQYRDRRKDIEVIQARISLQRQALLQLELQVRDRSTILLNLHQLQSQKR